MEANQILTADFLDLLFDGRNKSYGAFELRKNYTRRMAWSMGGTLLAIGLATGAYLMTVGMTSKTNGIFEVDSVRLVDIPIEEKPVIIPPQPKPVEKVIASIKYATIRITNDAIDENDKPPVVEDLADTRIALVNKDGIKDENLVAPVGNAIEKGIVEISKPADKEEAPFTRVEIESSYPGGASAWLRYLNKTFVYPATAVESGTQGTVVVQFIVDREGHVSEVQALSGPQTGGLREEAERVIRKSGRWEPALQNGRKVKSYKRQPITFRLEE